MAHNDVEIEIKTKLTQKEYKRVMKLLQKTTKFIKKSEQIDTYYSPAHENFLKPKYPFKWLSLRMRDNKVKLNYKHWYPEGVRNTTHCDEYETSVEDFVQAQKILKVLGFKELVVVKKSRLLFEHKDKFEIALDRVEDLGFFIEVESLKDMGGVKKTYRKILDFTAKLGVTKVEIVPGGYALALLKKKS